MTSELNHIVNLIKSKNEKVENICYKEVHKIKLDKSFNLILNLQQLLLVQKQI